MNSDFPDVDGLQAFVALLDIELHLLPFSEGSITLLLDGGEVHKHVLPSVLRDKAVALLCVEPLDYTGRHDGVPLRKHVPTGTLVAMHTIADA
jgi:hypothetical protein